jgi:hypothetical protein
MKKEEIISIIKPENGIETAIVNDAVFIEGCSYGKPRSGHPEGEVIYHIQEVLANIDKYYSDDEDRKFLRVIALVHDTFKHKVDRNKPKVGENHHGRIAMKFAENYTTRDEVLLVIERHDDAYNAWSKGGRHGDWHQAQRKANQLIQGLITEGCLDLYVKFYECDNKTGDKTQECFEWFQHLIK